MKPTLTFACFALSAILLLSAACGEDAAEDSSNTGPDNQQSDEQSPANQDAEDLAEDYFNKWTRISEFGRVSPSDPGI